MIRVYYMKMNGDCPEGQSLGFLKEKYYPFLSEERKEAVRRAKNPEVVKKRILTGAFLQCVLSRETGIPIEHLAYQYNPYGKPELHPDCFPRGAAERETGKTMEFNLSHSGEYVVLAVDDRPVGIDVEYKTRGYENLAKRCFCEEEYLDIMACGSEEEQERRFLECWTCKEAYIKWKGEGMRIPLNSFYVQRNVDGLSSILYKDGIKKENCQENCILGTCYMEDGYVISVCCEEQQDVYDFMSRGMEEVNLQSILV